MAQWLGCRIRLEWGDDEVFDDDDCDVRHEADALVVSWFDDEGPVVFAGVAPAADAPFELVCRSRPLRGALGFDDARRALSGTLSDGEREARWRIDLEEAGSE